MNIFTRISKIALPVSGQPVAVSKTSAKKIKSGSSAPWMIFAFFSLMLLSSGMSWGQVNIAVGNTVTQNFDGMGATAGATLPTGWKVDKQTTVATQGNYATAATTTDLSAGINISTTAGNGVYNFGTGAAGAGTDRAVGGLSSSAASKTVNVYADLFNNGAAPISSFSITYDVEKYRKGSNAAGFKIQLYYSTNGTSWTSAGANFLTSFPFDADNTGYAVVPGATSSVSAQTLTVSIPASSHLYLAWSYGVASGTTTSNAQALGIDNVSITAAGSAPVITNSPLTLSGTVGVAITPFTITATNSPTGYSTTALPAGLTFSSPTISGTPSAAGTSTFDITATNGSGSDTKTVTATIAKGTQAITFGALINRNDVDPNFALTATGGASGMPVTYTSSNTAVAQIVNAGGTVDPNGTFVDIVGPGSTTITASQAGNGNYFAATPVPQTQVIINTSLTPQVITFGALSNKIYGDANFQLTATGGGSGNPVTYVSSNTAVATIVDGSGNIDPNGSYVDIVGPGTTTITASQAGNGSYSQAADVSQGLTVNKKALTVSNATVDTKVYDAGVVANISGATLNGVEGSDIVNIATTPGTFADANVNNGIAVTAALTLGGADAVKYTLTQPTGLTGNITKASQTITFNALANQTPGVSNFNYTATATSGLAISYSSSDPAVVTIVSGSLVHIGVVGSATITASQAGNQNYFAATAVQQTQQVVAATPGSIFANTITDTNPSTANPYTNGQTFDPHLTVSGVGRGPGIVGTAAGNRYNANSWNVAALDPNKYFEFTLTPNAGYRIDFSSFVYTSQVSTATINGFAVRSSLDNFTANIGSPTSATSATLSTISLSGAAYQGITSAITFRVYAWGALVSGTTFSINDFVFNGNVFVAPPTAAYSKTDVSACGTGPDGTIKVFPSGVGPFHYAWTGSNGFTAGDVQQITGLGFGFYNVTVTDANLNTAAVSGIHIGSAFYVYVTNNGSVSSPCSPTGSIILYGNAGIKPYTYSLDGTTYQASNTFANLAAGPYTGYVKDSAGCVSTKAITVAAAPALVIAPFVRNATSCAADGSIEIYRTGGIGPYTYSIDGTLYVSNNKFLNLAAGPYTAYVKDSKGCTSSQAVTITQGAALALTQAHTNASSCENDGTIQVYATGGTAPYTYSLDDVTYQAGNSFGNLSAAPYTVYVKDSKGCTGNINVTINLNLINVTATATPATSCAAGNGKIQLFRTGGVGPFTYSIDGNTYQASNVFAGLAPGYYDGYVKDSKTCIGQLTPIYVGPDCGQRMASNNARNINAATKVIAANTCSALKVQAYPNPSAAAFVLQLEGFTNDKVAVIVTDIMGRKIYQAEGTAKQQYNFGGNFKPGLYNVQVLQGKEKKSITIVKE